MGTVRRALFGCVVLLACASPARPPDARTVAAALPDAAAPPPVDAAPPPDAAPTRAECRAGRDECCRRDGTILPATCWALDNGPRRGPGGWCAPCNVRCLPPDARIATPAGERAVVSLSPGDLVFTLDAAGERVAAPVVRVGSVPAAAGQGVLRVTLDDGRTVRASPGHPTADGRPLAALRPGDALDGARVLAVDEVPLDAAATRDLRPAGPTGAYWADGVLLGTTLPL